MTWTDAMTAEMHALLDDNIPAREVAECLSRKYGVALTKNAILGKRFRTRPEKPKERPAMDLFGKGIEELGDKDCRYAFGESAPYRFCSAPRKPGSSYCTKHHEVCWREAERPNPATAFKAGRPRHLAEKAA